MKRITIERYQNAAEVGKAGLIEGETDDGQRWILFLDAEGKPEVYWPKRNEDGGVVGDGIPLKSYFGVIERELGVTAEEGMVSTWPVWNDIPENGDLAGMRGIVFARVPGEGSSREKITKFLTELVKGYSAEEPAE